MDTCDVLIVGGGPAGSSCAWGLRSTGLDVLVLERSKFPREKVCGGWITPPVLKALQIDPEQYGRDRVLQPITGFKIACIDSHGVDVDYARVVSYGIRRCQFDEYLLRRCGARFHEETCVHSIQRTADAWIINGDFKARLLIGAGGHFCPVARYLGVTDICQPVVAQEMEFQMNPTQAASCEVRAETPEVYFCSDMRGYGWCFRKQDYLNVGLGRLDGHRLGNHMRQFCQSLRQTGRLSFDLPNNFRGHAYLLFGWSRRILVSDALMLVGDAAGLAYRLSGEGIRPAVESGLLAAKAIKNARGDYARDRLSGYSAELSCRLAEPQESFEAAAQYLPCALRNVIARVLFRNRKFCQRVTEKWFLHKDADQAIVSIV